MLHYECGVCGDFFAVIFLLSACEVLRLFRMWRMRAELASVGDGCDSASVTYAALDLQ